MKAMKTSKRFRIYKDARKRLAAAYPCAFPQRGFRPPLRVGILRDIVSDGSTGLSGAKVRLFLSVWTRSTSYLQGIAKERPRVCLDGSVSGDVSSVNALEARATLAARKKRSVRRFDTAI